MFDTLNYAKKLESVGVSRDQAETHVQMIAQIIEDGLATKQDLKDSETALRQDIRELRDEMQKLEYRLTIKLGVMMTVAASVMLAILKSHA